MTTIPPSRSLNSLPRYVGRIEAAHIIGFSVRTLDRLASNDPTFPVARKVGRHPRWLLQDLLDWMDEQTP